uniref:Integrase zinc-binding domain-containing protein n=1 Tax=Strigamia maritima TaxID=126957 RepID=T1IKE8_STRMM
MLKTVKWKRKTFKRSARLKTKHLTPPILCLSRIPIFIKPKAGTQSTPPVVLPTPQQPTLIPQPKRGRGRPRKIEDRTPVIPPTTLIPIPKINPPKDLRRRRGRPPKNPRRLSGIPTPLGGQSTRQSTQLTPTTTSIVDPVISILPTPIGVPTPVDPSSPTLTTPLTLPFIPQSDPIPNIVEERAPSLRDYNSDTSTISNLVICIKNRCFKSTISSQDSQVSVYKLPIGPAVPTSPPRQRSPRPGPSGLQLPVVRPLTEAEREAEKIHDPPIEHPPFELLPSIQEIITAQEEDKWSNEKLLYLATQQLPNDPNEAERIRRERVDYKLHKGLLCTFLPVTTDTMLRRRQIYLPLSLREPYFRALHYPPSAGHLGIEKTLRRLRS